MLFFQIREKLFGKLARRVQASTLRFPVEPRVLQSKLAEYITELGGKSGLSFHLICVKPYLVDNDCHWSLSTPSRCPPRGRSLWILHGLLFVWAPCHTCLLRMPVQKVNGSRGTLVATMFPVRSGFLRGWLCV